MTKIVNFRPLFYLFLAFALGCAFAYYIFTLNLVVIALAVIILMAVVLLCVFTKHYKRLLAVVIAFCVGLGAFAVDFSTYIDKPYKGERCEVVGRVDEFSAYSENYAYLTLTDVKINSLPSKNISLSVQSNEEVSFSIGQILSFETEVYSIHLFDNGFFDSYRYKKDVAHVASVNLEELKVREGNLTFAESIRLYVKDILHANMSKDIANLSYSALFGDKTELDKTLKEEFSVAGVAHLLAVSGLHIGFLVAIIFWLLKRCNVKGVPRFVIIAVFLLLYSYLCDFTPSVVRASLMCLTCLLLGLIGRQYDFLSSIGLSGLLILIMHPLYVFDAGFLMSFCSVLAIAMLYKVFAKIFAKIRMPKVVAEAVAIDISTTIAIAPILAIYFENLSVLSCITNLICIPVFSFAYSLLFVLVIIISVFKFLGFLLFVPEAFFKFMVLVVKFIAGLEWAHMPLLELSNFGLALFYLVLFIISPILMLKAGKKFALFLCLLIVGNSASNAFMYAPPLVANTYAQISTNNTTALIQNKAGEVFLIAKSKDLVEVSEYLVYKRIYKVDTMFLYGGSDEDVEKFKAYYYVDTVVANTYGEMKIGEFCIEAYTLGSGYVKAVYVETDATGFLFGLENLGSLQSEKLSEKLSGKNVKTVFQPKEYGYYEATAAEYLLSRDKINTPIQENFSTKVLGSFTFSFNNGIIYPIRSVK